ncbi:hypothetical protein [Streptomyces sp. NPDC047070]|uniref:hypothetical protein n=1 Tax=Streptomyces sp. NPDC047070 TaxID=3154923 RepID=UPI0034554E34
MTSARDLNRLTGRWVTVKDPKHPGDVWQGRLTGYWDRPVLILDSPGGGRHVLPAAFDVAPVDPTADDSHPQPDQAQPLEDLPSSGLLWLINRTVFHVRGLALALHTGDDSKITGWSLLTSKDDGKIEPWTFSPATDYDGFQRAEATLAAALNRPDTVRTDDTDKTLTSTDTVQTVSGQARLLACGHCYEENGEEVHPHPECTVALLSRLRAIPRVPHFSQWHGEHGRAYTRGWQSVSDELRQALAEHDGWIRANRPDDRTCSVCGSGPSEYENFEGQPFCWPCADGVCSATWITEQRGRARCVLDFTHHTDDDCLHEGPVPAGTRMRWNDRQPGATPHGHACRAMFHDPFHGNATCQKHPDDPATAGYDHDGRSQDGSTLRWRDGDTARTPQDTRPDTDEPARTDEPTGALTSPDTSPDTVRTDEAEPTLSAEWRARVADAYDLPQDILTTHPTANIPTPDELEADRRDGVRFSYTARVPRRQMGEAFLEAFGLLDAAQKAAQEERVGRPENAHARLGLAREVLVDDGYFTDDQIGPDLAPRLTEWLTHHRGKVTQAQAEVDTLRTRVGELARALGDVLGRFNEPCMIGGSLDHRRGHASRTQLKTWSRIQLGRGSENWAFPQVQGVCPACNGHSLFLGSGGYVTCSRLDCTDPEAPTNLLANAAYRLTEAQDLARQYGKAYEDLRCDVQIAAEYIRVQKTARPLGAFRNNRGRILDKLPVWIKDPGPLERKGSTQ